MARILVADDEEGLRTFLADALELSGHDVQQAEHGQAALDRLRAEQFHLLLTDLHMPKLDGMGLLRTAKQEQPELTVVVLTAHGSIDSAVEAMKLGALDYLQKPLASPAELRLVVDRALEHHRLLDRVEVEEDLSHPPLTYGAASMAPVVDALRKVASTEATVLLLGDSGTGKEVAAREVHRQSPRAKGPFVAVNCAALSESLLESELFGHEKGAFTGADQRRRGKIEHAEGGTFFLDEVGELKLELQAKLLRVLQEKKFERVGGHQTIFANVRWIAATNRDLAQRIAEGQFREDLYHRLSVFPVQLPPLRARTEDILPLAETLLVRLAASLGRTRATLRPEAQQILQRHSWPGNVRELANTLERALILAEGDTVGPEHILLTPMAPSLAVSSGPGPMTADGLPPTIAEVERTTILAALDYFQGNRKQAAEHLGMGLRTLYDKIKRYGLS